MELELRKLGLTEKEVGVYLAGLELGPSPVQKIAQMAGIARPTAYEIIKHLEEKGLFAEVKERGKKFFSAQSPKRILGILRTQKREIEEKEREFVRIISALEGRFAKEKEGMQVFKGKEGLKSLEEIISFTSTSDMIIINAQNLPITIGERKKIYQEIKKRLGKINVREIRAGVDGSLIVFDKIIYFPSKKQEGYLFS